MTEQIIKDCISASVDYDIEIPQNTVCSVSGKPAVLNNEYMNLNEAGVAYCYVMFR